MASFRLGRMLVLFAPLVGAWACAADPGDDPKDDASSQVTVEGGTGSGSSSSSGNVAGSGSGGRSGTGSAGSGTMAAPSDAASSGSASDDAPSGDNDVSMAPPPPSCPTCPLKLDYKCGATADPTQEIKPWFEIINDGMMPQALSELTIRYWYSFDADSGSMPEQFNCDYAQVDVPGGSNTAITPDVMATFGSGPTGIAGADSYMETSFTAAAGSIPPGLTAQIQMRFHKNGYSGQYVQAGDYSYNPADTTFVPSLKVVLYRMGHSVWGTEPGGTAQAGDP